MCVPFKHWTVFIKNIDKQDRLQLNQYKWLQIIKNPKDKVAYDFFKESVGRRIFIKISNTNLYELSKNYSDLIREWLREFVCYDGTNVVDNLEHYITIKI